MNTRLFLLYAILQFFGIHFNDVNAQTEDYYINAFKDTLLELSEKTDNEFFKIHCKSMVDVINSNTYFSSNDLNFIKNTFFAFNNNNDYANAKKLSTYLERKRPFIIAWKSPTDGHISFSWLTLPKFWDPNKRYPLYVQLHGLWGVASNPIEYMTYPYLSPASSSYAFEDGFLLSPWGRGNMWYQGISETDIWECIDALEKHADIDPTRKYLCGHSMGGYGTWHIAQNSPQVWAAIGLHAAALGFSQWDVRPEAVDKMKNVPVYFVCGNTDGLLSLNQYLFELIRNSGNSNILFVTFAGGHDYRQIDVEKMYLWMHRYVNTKVTDIPEIKTNSSPIKLCAFPNPFNTKTQIKYSLPKSSKVKLEILNNQGYIVDEIITDIYQAAGDYEICWIPENLPDGLYYYCLSTEYSKSTNCIIYRK